MMYMFSWKSLYLDLTFFYLLCVEKVLGSILAISIAVFNLVPIYVLYFCANSHLALYEITMIALDWF